MTPTRNFFVPLSCRFLAISVFFTILIGSALGSSKEEVIYRFQGGLDGYDPQGALLVDKAGNLYGSTISGGIRSCSRNNGCGTVFQLVPPAQSGGTWSKATLYRFLGGSDGYAPVAALIADQNGNLYGTTAEGGAHNFGTIFQLQPPSAPGGPWTHNVLYSFSGNPRGKGDGDGANPSGVVLDAVGNLYGTTNGGGFCQTPNEGGPICYGTVFKLAPPASQGAAWTESVLHRFAVNGDSNPHGGVILDKTGNLYGTAYLSSTYGFGGVFELIAPSAPDGGWTEVTLYDFKGSSAGDAGTPNGSLLFDSAGCLYGTTLEGGGANMGAVFQLTPSTPGEWTESVLYSFQASGDGNGPLANLIMDKSGNLFGTTWEGGSYPDEGGIVFELNPPASSSANWTENILHIFGTGADGKQPDAGLVYGPDGAFYSTATTGGSTKDSSKCQLDGYA